MIPLTNKQFGRTPETVRIHCQKVEELYLKAIEQLKTAEERMALQEHEIERLTQLLKKAR